MSVDNTEEFTVVEWCAGYGGIHLGLERAIPNMCVIAFSEIEAFACANLVAKMEAGHMDSAPVWTNLKTFPCAEFSGKVDLLVAGYPCQPFSAAGKRLGTEDERHLWPFILDGIKAMQPRFCFFENVEGHISLGLSTVLSDLAEAGYCTTWGIVSAAEVGAPHQRKRVFILGYREHDGLHGYKDGRRGSEAGDRSEERQEVPCESQGASGRENLRNLQTGELAYHPNFRIQGCRTGRLEEPRSYAEEALSLRSDYAGCNVWPSRPGTEQYGWEPPRVCDSKSLRQQKSWEESGCASEPPDGWTEQQTQPSMGGDVDGSTGGLGYAELCISCDNRTDELRLLGNGVVPAVAEKAWRTLLERLIKESK